MAAHDNRVVIPKTALTGRLKNASRCPSALIIDFIKFSSISGPNIKARIIGASGKSFSSRTKAMSPISSITQTSKRVLFVANAPITQKSRMIGNKIACLIPSIRLDNKTADIPRGTIIRLARTKIKKMAFINPASITNTIGPGVMPFIKRTPINIAEIVSPGIPKTRVGT